MNKYQATISIYGQNLKTVVFADDAIHARLILQYVYGFNSILAQPVKIAESLANKIGHVNQPRSPEKARVDALKAQKAIASKALKAAQGRQKIAQGQRDLAKAASSYSSI